MCDNFIGVDIGGTFTDFIKWNGKEIISYKLLSTPDEPELAVLDGLRHLIDEGVDTTVIHGSTVATNSLLERIGAKVALISTSGFEDILEIGRQNRTKIYDLNVKKTPPLVPQELRFGINERIDSKGTVLTALKEEEIDEIINKIKSCSVEAIAVCLLFSYVNSFHEEIIAGKFEQLNIPVSLSSKVLPEYREYERCSTVTANAFVAPKMNSYLSKLSYNEDGKPYPWKLRILQSNGGTIDSILAREEPVRVVLSGPAGGVVGANYISSSAGYSNIITFDMGGTSTDVSLCEGKITTTTEGSVGGYPIKVPLIDIHTVGAGGGSIAFIDTGGMVRVGPKSAGSLPGPVCFDRGGNEPTVTDAQFILGRIDSDYFWNGKLVLNREKTENVFKEMAHKLDISIIELASAIIRIANSSMEKAIKVISLERGYDPVDFTLVSFGGAGPLHACDLAKELSIPKIMVPKNAGTLSAFGMVTADIIRDYSKTLALNVTEENMEIIESSFSYLIKKGEESFEKENVKDKEILRFIDLRYSGQSYELTVPYNEHFIDNFHRAHKKRYHHNYPEKDIEAVTIRVKAIGKTKKPHFSELKERNSYKIEPVKRKKIFWEKNFIETPVYLRHLLNTGMELKGPAIIYESSSTITIPPGFCGIVDQFENIIINF